MYPTETSPKATRKRRERLRTIVLAVGLAMIVVVTAWLVGVVTGLIAIRVTGIDWAYVSNGSAVPGYAFTGSCAQLNGSFHPDASIHCQLQVWGPRGGYLSTHGSVSTSQPFNSGVIPPPACTGYGCQAPTSLYVVIVTPWLPGTYTIHGAVTG